MTSRRLDEITAAIAARTRTGSIYDVTPTPVPSLVLRKEAGGTVYRAFRGGRCLATALMRRPYSTEPLWRISTSDGALYDTADTNIEMRGMLRRAARAMEAK